MERAQRRRFLNQRSAVASEIHPDSVRGQRPPYEAGLCAGDDALRREVEAILAQHHAAGHYRILRKIGSGGMDAVFEAEDIRLRRQIKILDFGIAKLTTGNIWLMKLE